MLSLLMTKDTTLPEQWGSRPTWMLDGEPEPSVNPWLFWISAGVVVGASVGYLVWRVLN